MNNLKAFLRFLKRNQLYTFVNIAGLSLSLSFVILIVNIAVQAFSIDMNVKDKARIFLVASEESAITGFWNGKRLKERYPQIEEVCNVNVEEKFPIKVRGKEFAINLTFADTTLFQFFSINLLEGNESTILIPKENAVISRSFANRIFGKENPIGEKIEYSAQGKNRQFIIAGISEDIGNSILPISDIIVNSYNLGNLNPGIVAETMNNADGASLFIKINKGAIFNDKEEEIKDYFKTYFWIYKNEWLKEVHLIPFNNVYFSRQEFPAGFRIGSWEFVLIIMSIGFLILTFAVINYINLTVSQLEFRSKEIAIRRLIGSSKGTIFYKFIIESIIITSISFIIGLIIAITIEPFANSILNSSIFILKDFNYIYLSVYAALIFITSILSGVIPAWIISLTKPLDSVKGNIKKKSKMVYGKLLIGFQNIITIALIACSITVNKQVNHLINAPLGYNYNNIMEIDTWQGFMNYSQIKQSADKIKNLPYVEKVAQSFGTPINRGNNNTFDIGDGKRLGLQIFIGDRSYFDMFELKHKQGELINNGYYFTENVLRELGCPEDSNIIKLGNNQKEYKVSGIMDNIKLNNILAPYETCMFRYIEDMEGYVRSLESEEDDSWSRPWEILIQLSPSANKEIAISDITKIAEEVTGTTLLKIEYLEDQVAVNFANEKRVSYLILAFAFIALIISTLGLLAMSTYYIQQRNREIAVRKIFGSSSNEILCKLISNFMLIIIISFIISIPIIYYIMHRWLEGFTYKIALTPLIFIASGVMASIIGFLATYWQSKLAANENPVERIKK